MIHFSYEMKIIHAQVVFRAMIYFTYLKKLKIILAPT